MMVTGAVRVASVENKIEDCIVRMSRIRRNLEAQRILDSEMPDIEK